MTETIPEVVPAQLAAPQPVFNCPDCSHYLPPGSLVCPDCHALAYAAYLRDLAIQATQQESEGAWPAARDTWLQGLQWLPEGTKQYDAVAQRIAIIDQRVQAATDKKARWTKRLGPFAPIVFFLAKAKSFLFLIFKLKFILSFAGFILIYSALFGWKFGVGFGLSFMVHEMGHYVAAKRRGLKVDLPVFIPGMGAYVRWYHQGVTLDDLASISLAGPFFGLLFALVMAAITLKTGPGTVWEALAYTTAWLNVLNLIPVFFFDGGQAVYALDRTQRWLVLATSLIFFGMLHNATFLFVALGMGWRLWKADFPPAPQHQDPGLLHPVALLAGPRHLSLPRPPRPGRPARLLTAPPAAQVRRNQGQRPGSYQPGAQAPGTLVATNEGL